MLITTINITTFILSIQSNTDITNLWEGNRNRVTLSNHNKALVEPRNANNSHLSWKLNSNPNISFKCAHLKNFEYCKRGRFLTYFRFKKNKGEDTFQKFETNTWSIPKESFLTKIAWIFLKNFFELTFFLGSRFPGSTTIWRYRERGEFFQQQGGQALQWVAQHCQAICHCQCLQEQPRLSQRYPQQNRQQAHRSTQAQQEMTTGA
jgi:hypothetical protein